MVSNLDFDVIVRHVAYLRRQARSGWSSFINPKEPIIKNWGRA